MALPNVRPISEYQVSATLADLSTESATYAVTPFKGRFVRAYSVINNAITGADATWLVKINGTAVAGATATVANSGSAAGDVDVATPTSPNNYVLEGDDISFHSGGESSTTCITRFVAVIERD